MFGDLLVWTEKNSALVKFLKYKTADCKSGSDSINVGQVTGIDGSFNNNGVNTQYFGAEEFGIQSGTHKFVMNGGQNTDAGKKFQLFEFKTANTIDKVRIFKTCISNFDSLVLSLQ